MTDCELILEVLKDLRAHHVQEIFDRCKPTARNWAVRSRISDLKKKGHKIVSKIGQDGEAVYQLLPREIVQLDLV